MANTRIRIKQSQLNQIEDLKIKHSFGYNYQVLDLLLKNQKRYEDLENIIKNVHMKTKL